MSRVNRELLDQAIKELGPLIGQELRVVVIRRRAKSGGRATFLSVWITGDNDEIIIGGIHGLTVAEALYAVQARLQL